MNNAELDAKIIETDGKQGLEEPRPPAFSDEALALRFAEVYASCLRYVAVWGRWISWNDTRWQFDDTLSAYDLVRKTCRSAAAACHNAKLAPLLASAKTVAAVERLARSDLDGEAEALVRKAIQKAKQGNVPALRMCLDRILPPRRDRPIRFAIPELNSAADAGKAVAAIATAVARGELGVSEAAELSKLVETYVRAVEATDLEKRLIALEARSK